MFLVLLNYLLFYYHIIIREHALSTAAKVNKKNESAKDLWIFFGVTGDGITNPYIHGSRIANPTEQIANPTEQAPPYNNEVY